MLEIKLTLEGENAEALENYRDDLKKRTGKELDVSELAGTLILSGLHQEGY